MTKGKRAKLINDYKQSTGRHSERMVKLIWNYIQVVETDYDIYMSEEDAKELWSILAEAQIWSLCDPNKES